MNLYELRDLKQVFGKRTVLDIDRLDLPAGGGHALLGPNGCGKTTLLRILAFLNPPTSGEILFREKTVNWPEKSVGALRRQVVLVDQHPVMFSMTVIKNVEYGPRMRGVASKERRRIALQCLEKVGMEEFSESPAHLLSGGETQRVAIARALACAPDVMLFDEPTAGVDVENQAVIESVIRDICAQKGVTVIFSTHRYTEASRLARNRIFLSEGKLSGPG